MSRSHIPMIPLALFLGVACSGSSKYEVVAPASSNKCNPLTEDSKASQTPALVGHGNDYRNDALHNLASPILNADRVVGLLNQSNICFSRALRLTPDSYEAQLGMGIAYLALARMTAKGTLDRTNLLAGARHMLGRAYMLRHGAYEPLYYLAELAVTEGRLQLARMFLEPLWDTGVKEGPVNLLLGMISERQGERLEAMRFYLKALEAGWPVETFVFAADRLQQLDYPLKVKYPYINKRR